MFSGAKVGIYYKSTKKNDKYFSCACFYFIIEQIIEPYYPFRGMKNARFVLKSEQLQNNHIY
ncbi:hypothetical protein PJIAN_4863 [Paludibacter jiangxiensis]|uniref:Uncharacterized protein n=1 Tax=Paludibacter jiangxiensis TaxID=681398 RepID=A0A161M6J8_9BACT|nr:hypothetical protein PJIAN_4863 [Paludibacter jiangxiensis]